MTGLKVDKFGKKKGVNRKKLQEIATSIASSLSDKISKTDMYNLKASELSLKGEDTQLLSVMSGSLMEISTSNKYLAKLKEAEVKLQYHKNMMDLANQVMQFKIEMMKYNQQLKKDKADIISSLAKNQSNECDPMIAYLKLQTGIFTKDDKCLKLFPNKSVDELNSLYTINLDGDILALPGAILELIRGLNMYNK